MKNSILTEIRTWERDHNLNKKEYLNMIECFRRVNMFHNGNIDAKLLLLALPSEVKKSKELGLIKISNSEIRRALNWYELTDKGKKIVKDLINRIGWNEKEMNTEMFDLV